MVRTFEKDGGAKPNGSGTNGASKPDDKKDGEKKDDAKPAVVAVPAKPTPPPTPPPAPTDAALARAMELLKGGGFTRRLTWRDRWRLRRVEKAIDNVRQRLQDAFPAADSVMAKSLDSLAHIEVTARLEMMREPKVKK